MQHSYHITVTSTKHGMKAGRDERMMVTCCTLVSQMGLCEALDDFCKTLTEYSFISYQLC